MWSRRRARYTESDQPAGGCQATCRFRSTSGLVCRDTANQARPCPRRPATRGDFHPESDLKRAQWLPDDHPTAFRVDVVVGYRPRRPRESDAGQRHRAASVVGRVGDLRLGVRSATSSASARRASAPAATVVGLGGLGRRRRRRLRLPEHATSVASGSVVAATSATSADRPARRRPEQASASRSIGIGARQRRLLERRHSAESDSVASATSASGASATSVASSSSRRRHRHRGHQPRRHRASGVTSATSGIRAASATSRPTGSGASATRPPSASGASQRARQPLLLEQQPRQARARRRTSATSASGASALGFRTRSLGRGGDLGVVGNNGGLSSRSRSDSATSGSGVSRPRSTASGSGRRRPSAASGPEPRDSASLAWVRRPRRRHRRPVPRRRPPRRLNAASGCLRRLALALGGLAPALASSGWGRGATPSCRGGSGRPSGLPSCAASGAAASGSAPSRAPRRRTARRPAGAADRAACTVASSSSAGCGRRGSRRDERAHRREGGRLEHGDQRSGRIRRAAATPSWPRRAGQPAACGNGTPAFGGSDDRRSARTTRPTSSAASTSPSHSVSSSSCFVTSAALSSAASSRVDSSRATSGSSDDGDDAAQVAQVEVLELALARPRRGRASRRRAAAGAGPRPSSAPPPRASPACPRPSAGRCPRAAAGARRPCPAGRARRPGAAPRGSRRARRVRCCLPGRSRFGFGRWGTSGGGVKCGRWWRRSPSPPRRVAAAADGRAPSPSPDARRRPDVVAATVGRAITTLATVAALAARTAAAAIVRSPGRALLDRRARSASLGSSSSRPARSAFSLGGTTDRMRMPSMSFSVSTRSWSPTDGTRRQDRPVEHAPRLAGAGGAPGPRPVGRRARQLDLDAGRHGAQLYWWVRARHWRESEPPVLGAERPHLLSVAMPIYALGDQVPADRRDGLRPSRRRDHRVGHDRSQSSVWPRAVLRGDDGEIRIGARTSIQDCTVLHTTPTTRRWSATSA